ncbi:MAG: T9SS type A sorting domain-containing protein [Bacteroidia bacterium]
MLIRLLSVFLLTAFGGQAYACSCWGSEDFFVANGHPDATVILAKKIKSVDHGMEVKVIEQFSGAPVSDRITIWGDIGHLCRLYTSNFEDGETYILGLSQLPDPLPDYWNDFIGSKEKAGDYEISVCGLHWLEVDGNELSASWGSIQGPETQMKLEDFRDLFANLIPLQVNFFESPDGPYVDVKLSEGITQSGYLQLIDLSGRVLKQIAILPDEITSYALAYPDLPTAIYILRVQIGDLSIVRKVALRQP